MKTKQRQDGFSLIEIMLAMAIIVIAMAVFMEVMWQVIRTSNRNLMRENLANTLERITNLWEDEVKKSNQITLVSASEICLGMVDSASNPVRYYVNGGVLWRGWGGGSCTNSTINQPLWQEGWTVEQVGFEIFNETDQVAARMQLSINSGAALAEDKVSHSVAVTATKRSSN